MTTAKRLEDILEKFRTVHGDRYDYARVVYKNAHQKVEIICKDHGIFLQYPNSHWYGCGCPKCGATQKASKRKLTIEQTIADFISLHGDLYDYSLVNYINSMTKVDIICKIHGKFSCSPNNHKRGRGCPTCRVGVKSKKPPRGKRTINQLIDSFIGVHGTMYDYSKVASAESSKKVKIICKIHGEFEQRVFVHLSGAGCLICGRVTMGVNRRYSLDKVMEKFADVHGDRYDYSLVEYENSTSKVKIICSEHGVFEQEPRAHWSGEGCVRCALEYTASLKRISIDEAYARIRKMHGSRYDYSKTVYVNTSTPIEIICDIHGSFFQHPANHWLGNGCPRCVDTYPATNDEWIDRFVSIHGDRYDYRMVEYKKAAERVAIICGNHGRFWQLPFDHWNGAGCPECVYGKQTAKDGKVLDSYNEKWVADFLVDNNIKYDVHVKYTNSSKYTCDFVVKSNNVDYWIEVWGWNEDDLNKRFGVDDKYNKKYIAMINKYLKRKEAKIKMAKELGYRLIGIDASKELRKVNTHEDRTRNLMRILSPLMTDELASVF